MEQFFCCQLCGHTHRIHDTCVHPLVGTLQATRAPRELCPTCDVDENLPNPNCASPVHPGNRGHIYPTQEGAC